MGASWGRVGSMWRHALALAWRSRRNPALPSSHDMSFWFFVITHSTYGPEGADTSRTSDREALTAPCLLMAWTSLGMAHSASPS